MTRNTEKKKATNIISKMARLDQMISDLLDASRLGAGEKLNLKYKRFDFNSLLAEVLVNCRQLYGNRFVFESDGPALGYWSYDGIRRVLENLTNNAIKYSTPETPITLSLRQDEDHVQCRIQNQGEPISVEEQTVIFLQHRRLRTSDEQKGWGIGLFLARGIIESHGGTLKMESSKETGTTFTVDLPRMAIGAETTAQPSSSVSANVDTANLTMSLSESSR